MRGQVWIDLFSLQSIATATAIEHYNLTTKPLYHEIYILKVKDVNEKHNGIEAKCTIAM